MANCQREGCELVIKRSDPRARYCSPKCRDSANNQKYRARHAAKLSAYNKTWRDKNSDKVKQNRQDYYKNNKVKIRQDNDAWAEANPEASAEIAKKWRSRNRLAVAVTENRRRARKAKTSHALIRRESITSRWEYYGGKCWMCGNEAVAIDHVKPLSKGGPHIPANLRPSCQPCNSSKSNKWNGVTRLKELKNGRR